MNKINYGKKIAIFASGTGTNAENIIRYFQNNKEAGVAAVFSNKNKAGVIKRARSLGIPVVVFGRKEFYEQNTVVENLHKLEIDLVVLAGFIWLIPGKMIRRFSGKILNIHPALLPRYGGKGMYGDRVHKAVLQSGDHKSGISVHLVNEQYDEGKVIFQAKCDVDPGNDTLETLRQKVHQLEYYYYPRVIEDVLKNRLP